MNVSNFPPKWLDVEAVFTLTALLKYTIYYVRMYTVPSSTYMKVIGAEAIHIQCEEELEYDDCSDG